MPIIRTARSSLCVRVVLLLVASLTAATPRANARPIGMPDIQKLVNDSNVVAVVQVPSVRLVGKADVTDAQGRSWSGDRVAATLRVLEILKGDPGTNVIEVAYESNPDWFMSGGPLAPTLEPGLTLIVFLQCTTACRFTDPANPALSFTPNAPTVPDPPQRTPYLLVLQRIGGGLLLRAQVAATAAPSQQASWEFLILEADRNPYIDTLFRAALAQIPPGHDPVFRNQLVAALVRRGDLSVIPELKQALFSGDPNTDVNARANLLLALQFVDWHTSLPIEAEALHSASSDLRATAAQAIQNLRVSPYVVPPNDLTASATHILLPAVHDPDRDVAFYAMQALGFLNAHLDQRPRSTTHDANWNTCLQFWEHFPDPQ